MLKRLKVSIAPADILRAPPAVKQAAPTPKTHSDGSRPKSSTLVFPRIRTKRPMLFYTPKPALPTTFNPLTTIDNYYIKDKEWPMTRDPNHYPYKYYKITLMRGLIGLSAKTQKFAQSLGLQRRFQVTYRIVDPIHAGLILRLKELVTVELVNEINPPCPKHPLGFSVVGNVIGTSWDE